MSSLPRTKDGKVDGRIIYRRGADYERKIVKEAKKEPNTIAYRSAGSHSPVDVTIINFAKRTIELIQAKTGKYSEIFKERLRERYKHLNGTYKVEFKVI